MANYSTLNRFSRIQLQSEERKQQAHLKKIIEMQRHSRIDNSAPQRCPHIHRGFVQQLSERRHEIDKENEQKSKKLIHIMTSKSAHPPSSSHSPSPTHRNRITQNLSQDNTEYRQRVVKAKGKYDAREWRKEYEQHQEHLKLRKNNSVFTPLDIGPHRQRNSKTNPLTSSRQTAPT